MTNPTTPAAIASPLSDAGKTLLGLGLLLLPAAHAGADAYPLWLDPTYRQSFDTRQARHHGNPGAKAIYGRDDRIEIYEAKHAARQAARATVAFIDASQLQRDGSGTYRARNYATMADIGWCDSEPFSAQPTLAFCTGFLIAPDLVATAGHCVDQEAINSPPPLPNIRVVFDYRMLAPGRPELHFSDHQVYSPTEVIEMRRGPGGDWAVVRLDRPVTGREPVLVDDEIAPVGMALTVIGHPNGVPAKIADGAQVKSHQGWLFYTDLDTYGGNSGSPVFSTASIRAGRPKAEGILVAGARDKQRTRTGCDVSIQCAPLDHAGRRGYCGGEQVAESRFIAATVPGPLDDSDDGPSNWLRLRIDNPRTQPEPQPEAWPEPPPAEAAGASDVCRSLPGLCL